MTKLRDGRTILIRRIRPDDKAGLVRGLQALSARSVQRRFLTPKRRFSQAELRYLTEVDGRSHVALVVESPTDPSRRLIGVARFIRWHDDPEAAEAAIVVADDWQGRGVGTALARQLAARARGLGIKRFTATMAADNRPAHRLMETLSLGLEQRHEGATDELVSSIAA